MLYFVSPQNPDLSDPSITGGRIRGGDALLQVQVGNSGPSIIQNARVVINFPSRSPVVTGDFFFLYPSTLTAVIGVSTTASAQQKKKDSYLARNEEDIQGLK